MRKTYKIAVILSLIGLLGLLSFFLNISCAKKESEVCKIGVILPLTGNLGFVGEHFRNGMLCAFEKHPVKGVKSLFEDSKAQPKEGISIVNKFFLDEDVKIIVSCLSSVTSAILPLVPDRELVLMASVTSKSDLPRYSEWVFRYFLSSEDEVKGMLKHLEKNNVNQLAVLHIDDEFGLDGVAVLKRDYKGDIVMLESFSAQQRDFRALIAKMTSLNINDMYIIGYGQLYGILVKQARELGFRGNIYAFSGFGSPVAFESAAEAGVGVVFTGPAYQPLADVMTTEGGEFAADYEKEYGGIPDHYAAYGYDIGKLISQTMKTLTTDGRGEINPENIRKTIASLGHFEGVLGKSSQDEFGDFHFETYLYRVAEGGKIVKLTE